MLLKKGVYIPASKRRKKQGRMTFLMAIIIVFCTLLILIDKRMYPIVKDFAAAKAQILANETINAAVEEYLLKSAIKYDDLILLSRTSEGIITSAQVNTPAVNLIKTGVVSSARSGISSVDETVVRIPLGNLLGSTYFTGRGPLIPIKLKLVANIYANFENELFSAGINQTLHKINMNVSGKVTIMLPFSRETSNFESDYLIGQTVIVGTVPDAFTQVVDADDELDGTIMDFGAGIE